MKGKRNGYIGTAKIIGGASNRTSNLEHVAGRQSLAKKRDTRFTSPVRIRIVSHRSRLADVDGVSAKAAIDGLVHCGILADDGPNYVEAVTFEQVKVKNKADEFTEIWIETVENSSDSRIKGG